MAISIMREVLRNFAKLLGVQIEGPHKDDLFLLKDLPTSGAKFGMANSRSVVPDRWLNDGDEVEFAGLKFSILHAPGAFAGVSCLLQR